MIEYDFSNKGVKKFYKNFNDKSDILLDKINSVEKKDPLRETYIDLCYKLYAEKTKYEIQRKDYFESIISLFSAGESYKELLKRRNLFYRENSLEEEISKKREIIIEEERLLEKNYWKNYKNEMGNFVKWVEKINNLDFKKQR